MRDLQSNIHCRFQRSFTAFSIENRERPTRSKQSFEEPDAVMSARPDLWESWESNFPRRPGQPKMRRVCHLNGCDQNCHVQTHFHVSQQAAHDPVSKSPWLVKFLQVARSFKHEGLLVPIATYRTSCRNETIQVHVPNLAP